MLEKLEILLTDEDIPDRLNHVLKSIFIISQELINAIDCGLKKDERGYNIAAKKASTIWINDITEKW